MPKFYCDYCDVYLTHDSPSVRKLHNDGWKHKTNVRSYYAQYLNNEDVLARRKKMKKKTTEETNPLRVFSTNHLPFVPKNLQDALLKAPKKPSKRDYDMNVLKSGKPKFVNTVMGNTRGGYRGRGRGGYFRGRGRGRGGFYQNIGGGRGGMDRFQPTPGYASNVNISLTGSGGGVNFNNQNMAFQMNNPGGN